MIFIKKNTVMLTSHKILLMFQGKTYIFLLMLPTMKAKSVLTMNCFDSEMILCKVSIA